MRTQGPTALNDGAVPLQASRRHINRNPHSSPLLSPTNLTRNLISIVPALLPAGAPAVRLLEVRLGHVPKVAVHPRRAAGVDVARIFRCGTHGSE